MYPNFSDRIDKATGLTVTRPSILVLHYTAIPLEETLSLFQNPTSNVSAHYVVGLDGTVLPIIDESKRAWHAGPAYWRGITDVNSHSIGIEIVNLGYRDDYPLEGTIKIGGSPHLWYPYPSIQIQSVTSLCQDIIGRYTIESRNVVGHSDVLPELKTDPGPLFPWEDLAQNGVGFWSKEEAKMILEWEERGVSWLQRALASWGYKVNVTDTLDKQTQNALNAFQMHFRQKDS